jgi:hypothetical protein
MSGALEEVVAARPDLVLASTFTPPATRAPWRRLARMAPMPGGHRGRSEAQVREIARLVGHPERGEALVARIEQALASHAPPHGARPIPTLLWHGGGLVPGANTLISELMARAGLANYASAKGLRQSDRLPLELGIRSAALDHGGGAFGRGRAPRPCADPPGARPIAAYAPHRAGAEAGILRWPHDHRGDRRSGARAPLLKGGAVKRLNLFRWRFSRWFSRPR